MEGVRYSQTQLVSGSGYRADCSGYVSMCLGINPGYMGSWGGLTTVTLVSSGLVRPIEADALQPGDLVGWLGAETGGDAGHVTVFDRWLNDDPEDNRYYGYQMSPDWGPSYGGIFWLDGFRAWRYLRLAENAESERKDTLMRLYRESNGTVYLSDAMWFRLVYREELAHLISLYGEVIEMDGTQGLGVSVSTARPYGLA